VSDSSNERLGNARRFEDLWIWQQARLLVKSVYQDLGDSTPAGRDFGFRRQIQEAGVSIMNNIAEGFERKTQREFVRFLDMAKGSCGEVRSMYYTAEDLKYVSAETALERRESCRRIAAGIGSLQLHLRKAFES
jgi:four helix bundle protein